MTKKILFSLTFMVLSCLAYAQVGIGTTSPHSSSILDLSASDKALLVTRVSNVSAITSPTNGMIVYDLSLNCFRGFQNGVWSDCNFVNFSSGPASSSPTVCINTAMPVVTHTTSGANGIGTPSGLPSGLTATWANATITISGAPTSSGVFNYNIPLTGGSLQSSATGTITVNNNNTVTAASSSPTVCINTALTAITHTTTGATGIGTATGLPSGVTASWASNTITISGTPTAAGTFNYSIPLTGGCGAVNATGIITVNPNNTVTAASSSPTLCINTALTAITHTTTGASGIGAATGLPSGVTASWASNTITISGTPTAAGTFNYSIPLTGGCGAVNATGIITVNPNNTVTAASSSPTLCINTALTSITHTTTGATGIGAATGLPSGVTASWASNTITISGTPTAAGTFNYSIPLTGGCGAVNATGTITVNQNTVTNVSTPSICINTALTPLTLTTTGATGIGAATGLPSGVTASWASNTITISGAPTAAGTFNYSVPLTGGCGTVNATGTIIVIPNRAVSGASSSRTVPVNTVIIPITHTTTGATGISAATGLPTGVTASWASNTITVSGTPSVTGTFNYSIPVDGNCGANVNATGTIIVTPVVNSATGRIWMDRNLGATQAATSSTDFLAYGDLYQWGRNADGHQRINWTSATAGTPVNGTTATRPNADQAATPLFITINSGNFDWRGTTQNNSLWQEVSGINNPCPTGYRLPTSAEFSAEVAAYGITNSSTAFSSPLKFTLAGLRNNVDGGLNNVSFTGVYWTSTVSGVNSLYRSFTASSTGIFNAYRAYGFSARCIKN